VSAGLRLPEGFRYSCIGCGRSCTDFDAVAIDAGTAERLRRLPLFHPRLPAGDGGLPYTRDLTLRRVPAEGGGARCVYLDLDRRCALHVVHGPEAKPVTCRTFPFRFFDTPAGTFVGLSFACTAVLEERGELLEARRPELEYLARLAPRERIGGEVRVAPGRTIAWHEYEVLEADLLMHLDDATPLGRWQRHRLFRKDLLRADSVTDAQRSLAADAARAESLAPARGWLEAIREVERRGLLHELPG